MAQITAIEESKEGGESRGLRTVLGLRGDKGGIHQYATCNILGGVTSPRAGSLVNY